MTEFDLEQAPVRTVIRCGADGSCRRRIGDVRVTELGPAILGLSPATREDREHADEEKLPPGLDVGFLEHEPLRLPDLRCRTHGTRECSRERLRHAYDTGTAEVTATTPATK